MLVDKVMTPVATGGSSGENREQQSCSPQTLRLDDESSRLDAVIEERWRRRSQLDDKVALLAEVQRHLRVLREGRTSDCGATEAWERFYELYDPLVRGIVTACQLQGADADDCVQESWTELSRDLRTLHYDPARAELRAWIRQVVRRTVFRWKKRAEQLNGGGNARLEGDLVSVVCWRLAGPQTEFHTNELRQQVQQALVTFRRRISNTSYLVFYLGSMSGWSVPEICRHLDLSRDQVYARRHRMIQLFARLFPHLLADTDLPDDSLPPAALRKRLRKGEIPEESAQETEEKAPIDK